MFSTWPRYVDNGKSYVKSNVKSLLNRNHQVMITTNMFHGLHFFIFQRFRQFIHIRYRRNRTFCMFIFRMNNLNGVIVVSILAVIGVVKGFVSLFLLSVLSTYRRIFRRKVPYHICQYDTHQDE